MTSVSVPLLRSGDRLTRDEFERRYAAAPAVKKAELIDGVVHVPAAVRLDRHGNPHARLIGWLVTYETRTPGVLVGDNCTVRLDMENEPQPDGLLLIEPSARGQATISPDGYVEGAPELVAEVSTSSAAIDSGAKLRLYERAGVRECIVWRVMEQTVDWFASDGGKFQQLSAGDGVLRSAVFPGLWLAGDALAHGRMHEVLATLQDGLASDEHAAFVRRLKSARGA